MENTVKALEIAAGVLLGVIIMAAIVYFFSSIGAFPQEQADIKTAEQLAAFNLEYEVYDKKGMYGTDVISCLTKAESNNEKYVQGGKFLTGSKYGDDYWINVYVNIKSDLEENLVVYHFDGNNQKQYLGNGSIKDLSLTMEAAGFIVPTKGYTEFTQDSFLEPKTNKLNSKGKNYIDPNNNVITLDGKSYSAQLYDNGNKEEETPLKKLLKFTSSNMQQIVYNYDKSTLDKWSSAIWKTALYDFKTRRFRCDSIKYSKITGQVNELYFSEI